MNRQKEERIAALCHLLNAIPGYGILAAGFVLFHFRDKSRYLVVQSRQAIYFHLGLLAVFVVCLLLHLIAVLIGALIPPLGEFLVALNGFFVRVVVVAFVLVCLWGAWSCFSGRDFRYPLVGEIAA